MSVEREAEDPASAAWLCALPCAIVVALAMLVLGPPLGSLLSPSRAPYTFLQGAAGGLRPEPTEHARYLLALGAPLLAALATATASRWRPSVPPRLATLAIPATQVVLAGVLVASMIAQNRLRFGQLYTDQVGILTVHYFKPATLVVAALLAAATVLVVRRDDLRDRAGVLLRESRRSHVGTVVVAAALTAIWLLHAVHTDHSIAAAPEDVRYHLAFTLDETFAVLDGRTPLVNFTAQYASLWPFVVALPMLALGTTTLVFTLALCTIGGLALLAIFGVLRRVTTSSGAALLLYLPFLATSLFLIGGDSVNRSSVGTYYGTFPLRYAGPFLLAWLTARQLDRGARPSRAWLLFAAAGLVLLNNADFGAAALGASVAALLWTMDDRRRAALLRLAGHVAVGLAAAFALVSLLTLVLAGGLPQVGRLLDFARVYAIGGFSMMPIPGVLGFHLVIYLTYVATIGVATVRALRRAPNRVLTGMLAWAGVFGLGAASHYIGRSHPVALKSAFAAWALALALLTVVVVRGLAASPRRRPTIAAIAVLYGFGLAACSVTQLPLPWTQIQRLTAHVAPTAEAPYTTPLAPSANAKTRTFVSSLARGPSRFVVKRGAPVAILLTNGHRVADAYGVVDVSPYTGIESIITVERVDAVVAALRSAGGNTVILPNPLDPSLLEALQQRGFALVGHSGLRHYVPGRRTGAVLMPWLGDADMRWVPHTLIKMVDTRHLLPRALG